MPLIRTSPLTVPLYQLHFINPQRYPYILETTARPDSGHHHDILFAFPQQSLILKDLQTLCWKTEGGFRQCASSDFLTELDNAWQQNKATERQPTHQLPFISGWFVFLAYELIGQIEPRLTLPCAEDELPVAFATRIANAMIHDHVTGQLHLVAEDDWHLQQMLVDIEKAQQMFANRSGHNVISLNVHEEPADRYLHAVRHVKDYIFNGDVFQVNLSRLWSATTASEVDRYAIYTALRRSNPAPFFGLAQFDDATIYSSSPERLVRVRAGQVDTRPIAGTRPRLDRDKAEEAIKIELMQHPKERAEHIMLIDLERNDLGRVCIPGSVHVDEMMGVESYAHVHHIVSNVCGDLRSEITPGAVVRALFPGGTITGCPKVRCMEIIAELEEYGRGAYTGSMGYIDDSGDMDLNILIRTLVSHQRRLHFRAGAGIVADSDPEMELQETRAKARGMLLALAPD